MTKFKKTNMFFVWSLFMVGFTLTVKRWCAVVNQIMIKREGTKHRCWKLAQSTVVKSFWCDINSHFTYISAFFKVWLLFVLRRRGVVISTVKCSTECKKRRHFYEKKYKKMSRGNLELINTGKGICLYLKCYWNVKYIVILIHFS